jgi:hypothetical protein
MWRSLLSESEGQAILISLLTGHSLENIPIER